jgi:hypothetical protein
MGSEKPARHAAKKEMQIIARLTDDVDRQFVRRSLTYAVDVQREKTVQTVIVKAKRCLLEAGHLD